MAITNINSYEDKIQAENNFENDPTAYLAPATVPARSGGVEKRTIYFEVTLASQTTGEDILIGFIPKGAIILGGTHIASATLANSATTAIGLKGADESGYIDAALSVSDNVAILKAAAALSTTLVPFGITQALSFGYVAEKNLYLTLTTGTGTVATEVIRGYCDILLPV
jgi:hypothetical protein